MPFAARTRFALALLAATLSHAAAPAHADAPHAADLPASCAAAGAAAERAYNLPDGLLAAIGRIEAGRADPLSGRVVAWPWTINAQGQGHYFQTRAEAIAAVQNLQMAGIGSIDVGCFQINLMFHAGAFASLEQAFDVDANAQAAARFLAELYQRSGSWETAVAWYHSATPGVGEPYRDRVLADWRGGGLRIMPAAFNVPHGGWPGRARPPILPAAAGTTVRIAARGFGITVWGPSSAAAPQARPGRPGIVAVRAHGRPRGLPRIITP